MALFDMLTHYGTFDKMIIYKNFEKYYEDILNFEVFDDDVWVTSFIKSGTTWMQEMVWLIMNNLNFSGSLESTLDLRFPFIEVSAVDPISNLVRIPDGYVPTELIKNSVDFVKRSKRPRFIKTHLPWTLLPLQIQNKVKKPKIVYVARNPKDVCVSFYHHTRIIDGYSGTLEEFCELFLADKLHYCPYWGNVLPFWEKRNQENILFIKYEEMKDNFPEVIKKVGNFLGKSLTEGNVNALVQHLSFDSMKSNLAVNKNEALEILRQYNITPFKGDFIRSGKMGSYKSEMPETMVPKFDKWIEENSAGSGLKFKN